MAALKSSSLTGYVGNPITIIHVIQESHQLACIKSMICNIKSYVLLAESTPIAIFFGE